LKKNLPAITGSFGMIEKFEKSEPYLVDFRFFISRSSAFLQHLTSLPNHLVKAIHINAAGARAVHGSLCIGIAQSYTTHHLALGTQPQVAAHQGGV
jgi:hypothetical protein